MLFHPSQTCSNSFIQGGLLALGEVGLVGIVEERFWLVLWGVVGWCILVGYLGGVVGRFVYGVLAGSFGLFVGIRGFGSGFLHPVNGHQVEFI